MFLQRLGMAEDPGSRAMLIPWGKTHATKKRAHIFQSGLSDLRLTSRSSDFRQQQRSESSTIDANVLEPFNAPANSATSSKRTPIGPCGINLDVNISYSSRIPRGQHLMPRFRFKTINDRKQTVLYAGGSLKPPKSRPDKESA